MVRASGLRPPVKWAGGKRWLAPRIRRFWEPYRERPFVEPFCGGLAVALALVPEQAFLNDINPHLVNFYRWLQAGLMIGIVMENDSDLYYEHRRRFNELLARGEESTQEAAELFYYLNRTGYNGLCRFNRSGEFNVPYGRYARINYVRDFSSYRRQLSKWDFSTVDFEGLTLDPDAFVYADPPYDVDFTQYAREDFSWADQVRLVRWLGAHRGPVVLSNEATDRIVELYMGAGFTLEFVDGPRRISCTGDRTPSREVLATRGL